jgi:phage FluMu protein Com
MYFTPVQINQDRGRCPVCRTVLLVRSPEEVVIRNAILRVEASGRVIAKCPRCKAWVEVPLRYVG